MYQSIRRERRTKTISTRGKVEEEGKKGAEKKTEGRGIAMQEGGEGMKSCNKGSKTV